MKKEHAMRIIVRRYVSELFNKYERKNCCVKSISTTLSMLFCERRVMNLSKVHLFFIKSYRTSVVVFPFNL